MAKINILYLHEFSKISGAENSLLELARFIDRSRFEPIFVLPEPGPLLQELRKINIEVILKKFPKIRTLIGVLAIVRQIRTIIRDKGIGIVHSNSIRTHLYAYFASINTGARVVWHQRNLLISEIFDPDRLFSFLPDAIVCNSYAVACRFNRRGKNLAKVSVVYSGVDLERFNPGIEANKIRTEFNIDTNKPIVGIIGRLDLRKGHEYFFRAARIVIDSIKTSKLPEPIFLVVGEALFAQENSNKQHLIDLIKQLDISDAVIFTGFRMDMPNVLAGLDIVVSASLYEACSRVVLEAMASAKAVIATDSGGSIELIENGRTGILVPERDPKGIAQAVISLVNDTKKREEMGRNARRKAEESLDIKICVKKIENIYENLLKNDN